MTEDLGMSLVYNFDKDDSTNYALEFFDSRYGYDYYRIFLTTRDNC